MIAIKCFMTIFILAKDGAKGLKEKQKIAEGVLSNRGFPIEGSKEAKNGRRVTVYTTIESRKGEDSQKAIDKVAREISEATDRSTVGRPEGWSPKKK
jgi:hypothetical protein